VSDTSKKLQDAVVAVMPEATRDLIAKIKLDGMFGGGSSEFYVELVDGSVCAFEAKQTSAGGLRLLSGLVPSTSRVTSLRRHRRRSLRLRRPGCRARSRPRR
jgi:hypothetical protein